MKTTIADFLKTKDTQVLSTSSDTSIYDAVQILQVENIGSLMVIDDGKVVGILRERDWRRAILEELDTRSTPVAKIMTHEVLHVEPETHLEDCMALMTEKRTRHLPVIKNGQVVGLVSVGDVVKFLCTEQGREIANLEKYISGSL